MDAYMWNGLQPVTSFTLIPNPNPNPNPDPDPDPNPSPTQGPRTVALFSHGIAIRSFVRGILGADAEFTVHAETDNCSLTVLKYRPGPADDGGLGGWVLKCFNA